MRHRNIALFVPDEGCPHRCSFCNQRTISGSVKRLEPQDVHEAVKIALQAPFESIGSEIAFFGGSFTAIERGYMISLLESAKEYIDKGVFSGIRISTRPDCIDDEILCLLKKYRVTAVEIGCQSMSDRVLALNARGHSSADIINAAGLIRKHGFELGVQMMTGLLGDDDETAVKTAKRLIALSPDTARIYPTVVLSGTALEEAYLRGEYRPQSMDEAVSLCSRLLLMFEESKVRVIRLGLHSGGNVEDGYVAGAYHPAFRELCESKIYFDKTMSALEKADIPNKKAEITVGKKYISQFLGQKRSNVNRLASLGYEITVRQAEELKQYQIIVQGRTI